MKKNKEHICRMLSLDTSTKATGWAYWENGILKSFHEINLNHVKDKENRLDEMCKELLNVCTKLQPHIIVIEMTVVPNNAQTQRQLTEIVGVVRGYAYLYNAEFVRLRPTQWRRLVKDEGEIIPIKRNELKGWSLAKVSKLYRIDPTDITDNVSDAILVGKARINMFPKD